MGPVFFDMEEERIRKRELEEQRIKAEMEEKMKTMTRKERKNYMKKIQWEISPFHNKRMQKKNKLKEMIFSLKIFQFRREDEPYFKMLSSRLPPDDVMV